MKSAKQGHANAQIILDDPNSFSLFSFVTCFIVAFCILAIAMHRRSKTSSAEMHAAQLLLEEKEESKAAAASAHGNMRRHKNACKKGENKLTPRGTKAAEQEHTKPPIHNKNKKNIWLKKKTT